MDAVDWRQTRAGKRWLALYGHRKKVRITWLARARILSGMSVAQAAKACGLNHRTWEGWERGGREPGGRAVLALATHLRSTDLVLHLPSSRVRVNPQTLEVLP